MVEVVIYSLVFGVVVVVELVDYSLIVGVGVDGRGGGLLTGFWCWC